MTPYDMAREQCANFAGAECIGAPDGRCLLASQRPCSYFKDSVLPLADKCPRYGRVVGQFNDMVARRGKAKRREIENLFRAFGRQGQRNTPCEKCLNCRNGHRQMCLSTLKLPVADTPGEPAVRRIVVSYCRTCKAPIYTRHDRYCTKACLKGAAKERRRQNRARANEGCHDRRSKPLVNTGPLKAVS